jgi:hypothetical protein
MPDKERLLGQFRIVDLILWHLENGAPLEELIDSYDEAQVQRIVDLYEGSRFMRESPYGLDKIV